MWRRERETDALTQYKDAITAASADRAQTERFTSALPSAPPTTAGERHAFELAEKADPDAPRKVLRRILIHGTWITVGLVGAFVAGNRDSDEAPAIGECATFSSTDELAKVDCGDKNAKFRVTSRVDDVTDGDAACASDPEATSHYSYSSVHRVVEFVLCLKSN